MISHCLHKTATLFFCIATLGLTAPAITWGEPLGKVKHTHGLLWQISRAGVAPSYLFGTMHSTDPRVTRLSKPLINAFDQAESFSMELIFTGAGLVHMAEIMFFGKNQSLEDVIGKDLYTQTRIAMESAGLSTRGMNKKKPWAIIMALGAQRPAKGALFLDLILQKRAVLQFKPTYGLETMKEQLQVFDSLSMEEQTELLRSTLRYLDQSQTQMTQLMQAYVDRDLARIAAISDQYQNKAGPAYDKLMDHLLVKRNHRMLQRMQARLKEGKAFIAIGALHLPGREGLLSLLEKSGYQVRSLY